MRRKAQKTSLHTFVSTLSWWYENMDKEKEKLQSNYSQRWDCEKLRNMQKDLTYEELHSIEKMRSRGQRLWNQKPEAGHVGSQHEVFFFPFWKKENRFSHMVFLEFFWASVNINRNKDVWNKTFQTQYTNISD